MTSKGIRRLRAVESDQQQQQEQQQQEIETPVNEAPAEPTLEQLRDANKAIEAQIAALGAQLTEYNNVVRNLALEALIGLLIESGLIDQYQFELRKEAALNIELSKAFAAVQVQALQRQRSEMRKQADLEVVKGPGLVLPNGAPRRLHG